MFFMLHVLRIIRFTERVLCIADLLLHMIPIIGTLKDVRQQILKCYILNES